MSRGAAPQSVQSLKQDILAPLPLSLLPSDWLPLAKKKQNM